MSPGIQIDTAAVAREAVQIDTLPSASFFSPFDVTEF
jgi:hypothetical protein